MQSQGWPGAYQLWQASRHCETGLDALGVCALRPAWAMPAAACSGPADGLNFLTMHRYLLHSLRSIWPGAYAPLTPWRVLPEVQDYPPSLRSRWVPWPAMVRRAAASIDTLARMEPAQVLARWPSEGAFGQWLQCGSMQGGQEVDALYPALLSNATVAAFAPLLQHSPPLDEYVFWRTHAWIDKAWDSYRKALGKTPDDPQLQAALLQQCQVQAHWAQYNKNQLAWAEDNISAQPPLFVGGQLNGKYGSRRAWVLGQVVGQVDWQGRRFYRLDLHLMGVAPIWATSVIALAQPGLALDARYKLAATPVQTRLFLPDKITGALNKDLQDLINTDQLLLVSAVQSVQ